MFSILKKILTQFYDVRLQANSNEIQIKMCFYQIRFGILEVQFAFMLLSINNRHNSFASSAFGLLFCALKDFLDELQVILLL